MMGKGKPNRMLMFTYGGWTHASSRIRAMAYIPMLEHTGEWKVHHFSRAPQKRDGLLGTIRFALLKRLYIFHRYWLILVYPWKLIFAQRIFLSSGMLLIAKWRNIPLLYDFDDAIYVGNGEGPTVKMIKDAEHIIVSSHELKRFCARLGKDAAIIPSPIDLERYSIKKTGQIGSSNPFTIGWIGSPWTENYLNEIAEALRTLGRERPYKLLLVGASEAYEVEGVEIEKEHWSYRNEVDLLHKMDIGIMPLPDNDWSRGKGGYKLYQYMATGLPVVASPVGINTSIVDHGSTGFLAHTAEEWVKYLRILMSDGELRKKMGEAGREKAAREYSYDACFISLNQVLKATIK